MTQKLGENCMRVSTKHTFSTVFMCRHISIQYLPFNNKQWDLHCKLRVVNILKLQAPKEL